MTKEVKTEKLRELGRIMNRPLIECMRALTECDWDQEDAIKWLENKRPTKYI